MMRGDRGPRGLSIHSRHWPRSKRRFWLERAGICHASLGEVEIELNESMEGKES